MSHRIEELLEIMRRLRDPRGGCSWDRKQDFSSIAPYTIEEAYEVADAIQRRDVQALKSEPGDLLFQVVFHAELGREEGVQSALRGAVWIHGRTAGKGGQDDGTARSGGIGGILGRGQGPGTAA